jgi:5-amino-6-(5-phosphoribosylamino)uracil reductase/diaminohydroxyphosphoribosylaminopyrimidine deaminase/5-amino-6-(5-phosphoribosylamino)uracil reductase
MSRPLVTLYFAQSLDGRIGFGRGHDRALLSSEQGILRAHRARSLHDAVLVGIETVLLDDPRLTVRACEGPQPRRVVLDSKLRTPTRARLFEANGAGGEILIFGTAGQANARAKEELEASGACTVLVGSDQLGRVSLPEMLDELHARGTRRLLVEGGAMVLTSFLRARLADRAEIDIAPCLLGGPAIPSLRDLGTDGMNGAVRLERLEIERLGPDVFVHGDIVYPGAASDGKTS